MNLEAALSQLGFLDSPNYLPKHKLRYGDARSYAFRKAISTCFLHGAYVVSGKSPLRSPVVLVAEVDSATEADAVHKRLWNQNLAPLVLVNLPTELRLYHAYTPPTGRTQDSALITVVESIEEVSKKLEIIQAHAIDSGKIWSAQHISADARRRVDGRLLSSLDAAVRFLAAHDVEPSLAYSLIGKLLFLRYLRDRKILSDRKLNDFGLDAESTLGARLKRPKFQALVDSVESWLGGRIFPMNVSNVSETVLRHVASALNGTDVTTHQLGFDFSLFDFSHVPIELLASVYQRLLHSTNAGREHGAYYTPGSLIEFVLDEVEELSPLTQETTVFDPSCGSGSFLVYAFRRLVETRIRRLKRLSPSELRRILTRQVFGVDQDAGACEVAQLSLLLTMLDYVEPPDLASSPRFKLPDLRASNIVQEDFFDPTPKASSPARRQFDWVVGNPPWTQVNGSTQLDSYAFQWMRSHRDLPVASNQLAEAFTWKSMENVAKRGAFGLVLPTISFFKSTGRFREALSTKAQIASFANFSAFAPFLFDGASTAACSLVGRPGSRADGDLLLFFPLAINQPGATDVHGNRSRPTSIVINRSEVKRVSTKELSASLPRWKALSFATARDARLLDRLESRFPTLESWLHESGMRMMEGAQLRDSSGGERLIHRPELAGKFVLEMAAMRGRERFHSLPAGALRAIRRDESHLRARGGVAPLSVATPPHVVVSAALSFAVYSEAEFLIPPRQIGIGGGVADELKILSLFLSSSWVRYHQFFASPQGGVRGGRTTLAALKQLPTPLAELTADRKREWLRLHAKKVEGGSGPDIDVEIDELVWAALKLDELSSAMVSEFVSVYAPLTYGANDDDARGPPTAAQLGAYASTLSRVLAAHQAGTGVCDVHVRTAAQYGVADISRSSASRGRVKVDGDEGLPELSFYSSGRTVSAQWVYFDRNMLIVQDDRRVFLKPMQYLWWTRSQAVMDAERIAVGSLLGGADESSGRVH